MLSTYSNVPRNDRSWQASYIFVTAIYAVYDGHDREAALDMFCQEAKTLGEDTKRSSDTPGLRGFRGGGKVMLKFFSKNGRALRPFTAWTETRQRDLIMENDMDLRLRHMDQAQVNN